MSKCSRCGLDKYVIHSPDDCISKLKDERDALRAEVELLANNAKPLIDAAIQDRDYWLNETKKLRAVLEKVVEELGGNPPAFVETRDHYYKNADVKVMSALRAVEKALEKQ